jgi:hypothetical protein
VIAHQGYIKQPAPKQRRTGSLDHLEDTALHPRPISGALEINKIDSIIGES